MESLISNFIDYLHNEKNTSGNTELSYERDLKKLTAYLKKQGIESMDQVRETDLKGYLAKLQKEGYESSTISRNIASIRSFFLYLFKRGMIREDPAENLKAPKVEKKMPEILTVEEVDRLLRQPNPETYKGMRDKAMLELLYAAGMRVSDDDDKIRLNQRKTSKYKGLSRFGPEKNLQRINKFMKERPIFYKNLIQMKENIRFYLRCFYCITKVVILQFNSEKQDRISS